MKFNPLTVGALIAVPLLLTACGSTTQQEALKTQPVAYNGAFGTTSAIDWEKQCDPYIPLTAHGTIAEGSDGVASPEEAVMSSLVADMKQDISIDDAKLDVVSGAPEEANFRAEVLVTSADNVVAQYTVLNVGKGGTWIVVGFTQCSQQRIVDGEAVTDK